MKTNNVEKTQTTKSSFRERGIKNNNGGRGDKPGMW